MHKHHNTPAKRRKVFAYVDGFNLYHRTLEGFRGRKWLNLRALLQSRFPNDEIALVRLVTASIDDTNPQSERRHRQATYWRVLRDTGVAIDLGRIEPREHKCKAHACGRYLTFSHAAEKMSDVWLALRIVTDAADHQPDIICIVTADLDMLPAVQLTRQRHPRIRLELMLPGGDPHQYYSRVENFGGIARITQITAEDVANFQFPDPYVTRSGHALQRPPSW